MPEYRDAETRLALFLSALQRDRRERAARLFSARVTAPERRAFLERRWLVRDPRRRDDFAQILFLPDIQIRTRAIYRDYAQLFVVRRAYEPKKTRQLTGYFEVPMRKENGRWFVELHPPRR